MATKDVTIILKNGNETDVESTEALPYEIAITRDSKRLLIGDNSGKFIPLPVGMQMADPFIMTAEELANFEYPADSGFYPSLIGKVVIISDGIDEESNGNNTVDINALISEDINNPLMLGTDGKLFVFQQSSGGLGDIEVRGMTSQEVQDMLRNIWGDVS